MAALDHLQAVAHETMRLISKSRVVPVGGADQSATEQGGRDLLFQTIEASQHVARRRRCAAVNRASGTCCLWIEPMNRSMTCSRSCATVERNDGGKRFAWLGFAKKRQLHAARPHMKADLVTPA
nr:hypothetical protein [Mesorhizobium sp. CA10]